MNILLVCVGKTDSPALEGLIQTYCTRLGHYLPFELKVLPDVRRGKHIDPALQKQAEGQSILSLLSPTDRLILLDERGHAYTSRGFAQHLEGHMLASQKRLVFVIGGPYGFSEEVYSRANEKITLSSMTFSHQMVRLFAVEQLYRAMTILRGEPYHHD